MDTKTSQAIEYFKKGDYKKALSIFKTFKIGFTKDERDLISTAYEVLSGKESFYKQLGIDTKKELSKAIDLIKNKYKLKESVSLSENSLLDIKDGIYDGFIQCWFVIIPELNKEFKCTFGIKNSFPFPCKVEVCNGLAKAESNKGLKMYSSKEAENFWSEKKSSLKEKVVLDIEKGDTILTGKFKNKKVIAKDFGTDDKGQPTINGKPILKIRIQKLMNNIKEEELVKGGLADKKTLEDIARDHVMKTPPRSYADDINFGISMDQDQLFDETLRTLKLNFKIGVKVEMEHTNSIDIAKEIAKDHLAEDPNYYQKLKTIEPIKETFNNRKKKLLESILKEQEENIEDIIEIVRKRLPKVKEKKYRSYGDVTSFSDHLQDASSYFIDIIKRDDNRIDLNMQYEKIIKGESLADPRAKYQTTSASKFKRKKKKVSKIFKENEIDKAKKEVNKFLDLLKQEGLIY